MDLFFDTETTGFPQDGLPPEHKEQAHLVEIGAQLYDGDRMIQAISLIINPGPGITFSPGAVNAHGITPERAEKEGVHPRVALSAFAKMASLADQLIAHNAKFDLKIIALAAARLGVEIPLPAVKICTMELSTPLAKIAGPRGYKWPKLEEAFKFFLPGEPWEHAHSAMYDCTYCRRIFHKMRDMGVVQ